MQKDLQRSSRIAVIGAGFSGMSAAAYLSHAGYEVHIFEKNDRPGGRARQFSTDSGYVFDMGPSWYWMPDVFEKFFSDFGHSAADFYKLKLLDPSFEMVFRNQETMAVPEDFETLCKLFESIEAGSSVRLKKFMTEARYKYEKGMKDLVYMPGLSLTEFADWDLVKNAMRLQVFSSFSKHVRKYFKDQRLISLMEFPVLFLGAMPQDTPALYSLMNYAGLKLGTWYPMGGFGEVVKAMVRITEMNGAKFHYNAAVEQLVLEKDRVVAVRVNGEQHPFDAVVGAADYAHIERELLPPEKRNYRKEYWEKKTFAPSCLIYYVGLNKKVENLSHHTLFFEEDLLQHAKEIYKDPKWPEKPLFYVCCPSKTDNGVAPEGHENLFFLMPLAPGLQDTEELRESYFQLMLHRLEKQVGEEIGGAIDYSRSYCVNDFINDYHSYKGNAYGLANTLDQTALFKPKIRNKKVRNLFYAGQLTVPGPGVPPSLISGKIAATQLQEFLKAQKHEVVV